jgi:nucleoid DNA-binding protein
MTKLGETGVVPGKEKAPSIPPVAPVEKKRRARKSEADLDSTTDLVKTRVAQELQTLLGHRIALETGWHVLGTIFNIIFGLVKEKEYVRLPAGLGCFFMKHTKPTKRTTPQGKTIDVPELLKIRYRPGKLVK